MSAFLLRLGKFKLAVGASALIDLFLVSHILGAGIALFAPEAVVGGFRVAQAL